MRCFIAMAFGRADTDAIFDRVLRPCLKESGITPIRVDEILHNDNIDQRILHEINTADFAIVDLTYARPSVYFEAGYAEHIIPVIYTIRRDHLSPSAEDKYGNFLLHFDLSMRNIIDWSSADDDVFKDKLLQRILFILQPLNLANEEANERKMARSDFQLMPLNEQMTKCKLAAEDLLVKYGFKNSLSCQDESKRRYNAHSGRSSEFLRVRDQILEIATIKFWIHGESIYSLRVQDPPDFNLNIFGNIDSLNEIREITLLCCLGDLAFSDFRARNADYAQGKNENIFLLMSKISIPDLPSTYAGEVILTKEDREPDLVKRIWNGGNYGPGFLSSKPPIGSKYKPSWNSRKDFQFVYGGVLYREIRRSSLITILNSIASLAELTQKTTAALDLLNSKEED